MKTEVCKADENLSHLCKIKLFNNVTSIKCEFKPTSLGQDLMDYVCDYLNIQESHYWGLRFLDKYEQRHWLLLHKHIGVQVVDTNPIDFQLRLKIYPKEPHKIQDIETKYQIFMQLRQDLVCGRLGCSPSDSSLLMGLILQHKYGDYDENVHQGNYVTETLVINQSFSMEMKAIEMHKTHLKSLSIEQAQDLFLRVASQMETYGIEPFLVENANKDKLTLWINYKGIAAYQDIKNTNNFEWMSISKINQDENRLNIHLITDEIIVFYCLTEAECEYVYQSASSHWIYFTSVSNDSIKETNGIETEEDESIPDYNTCDESSSVIKTVSDSIDTFNERKLSICNRLYNFFICRLLMFIIIILTAVYQVSHLINFDPIDNLKNHLIHNIGDSYWSFWIKIQNNYFNM